MRNTLLTFSLALLVILAGCDDKSKNGATRPTAAANSGNGGAVSEETEQPLMLDYGCDLDYLPIGDIYEQEIHPAFYHIVNVSSKPQTIVSVEPTCECTHLSTEVHNTVLQPGERLRIDFEMLGPTLFFQPFARFMVIKPLGLKSFRSQFVGELKQVAEVTPERDVKLPMQKKAEQPWEMSFEIKGSSELDKTLVLGQMPEDTHLKYDLTDNGNGNYTLKVTPRTALPYSRSFKKEIVVPVLEPARAVGILLTLTVQVAEPVNFVPDKWTIAKSILQQEGSLTAHFAYGVVPGIQEDVSISTKDMLNRKKLMQHNAVPIKFVKEHHDWDDLFEHLNFRTPENVKVEKVRHPTGIELLVTVTPDSFAKSPDLQIVPFRDVNDCAPINISLVEE